MNGQIIHTLQRNVVVNRPTIQSIVAPPGIRTNTTLTFTVNHNTSSEAVWSVTPNHGVSIFSSSNNALMVWFAVSGNYTVTASITNGCGTHTMSKNIFVPGTQQPICLFCGSNIPNNCPRCSVPILLNDPIEEAEI